MTHCPECLTTIIQSHLLSLKLPVAPKNPCIVGRCWKMILSFRVSAYWCYVSLRVSAHDELSVQASMTFASREPWKVSPGLFYTVTMEKISNWYDMILMYGVWCLRYGSSFTWYMFSLYIIYQNIYYTGTNDVYYSHTFDSLNRHWLPDPVDQSCASRTDFKECCGNFQAAIPSIPNNMCSFLGLHMHGPKEATRRPSVLVLRHAASRAHTG